MPKTIFHHETNAKETWLEANEDGSFTHHAENSGWSMMRAGPKARDTRCSLAEAIEKWPSWRPRQRRVAAQTVKPDGAGS
jgi:hypothetical protein